MRPTHHARGRIRQNADPFSQNRPFRRFSPNGSALWRPHRFKSRRHCHQLGELRHARVRHADAVLRMAQNPHRHRCGRYCEADEIGGDYLAWPCRGVAGDERPVIGDMDGAERTQDSPNKNRAGPLRYKTRPADPFSPDLRYKTLPARSKSPYWHVLRVQGELYTAVISKKPCGVNFVPNTSQRRG